LSGFFRIRFTHKADFGLLSFSLVIPDCFPAIPQPFSALNLCAFLQGQSSSSTKSIYAVPSFFFTHLLLLLCPFFVAAMPRRPLDHLREFFRM